MDGRLSVMELAISVDSHRNVSWHCKTTRPTISRIIRDRLDDGTVKFKKVTGQAHARMDVVNTSVQNGHWTLRMLYITFEGEVEDARPVSR